MWAILSDIHGNLEALQAVLSDATACGVDQTFCLGDTVGYGPDPLECAKQSMAWQVVLRGNFEVAVLSDDDLAGWTAISAARSVFWSRRILSQLPRPSPVMDFLLKRPHTHEADGTSFVHGSPSNPLNEYVYPEDTDNQRKMDRIFARIDKYCFQGHTHVPGVFTESIQDDSYQFQSPEELADCTHNLDERKTMVNVGSVGQPRDGDWRACYVLFDGSFARFRRVEYDIKTTIRKIYANPELDNFLGDRLRDGR